MIGSTKNRGWFYRAGASPRGVDFMTKATTSVAPTNRECHPERSEGSLSPASQTLRCAQGDTRLPTENVILSAAKDLCPRRVRPFAALRVTLDYQPRMSS